MPEFVVDFEVYCSCGEGLCHQSFTEDGRRGHRVTVEPCPKCMEAAEDKGYDRGYGEQEATDETR